MITSNIQNTGLKASDIDLVKGIAELSKRAAFIDLKKLKEMATDSSFPFNDFAEEETEECLPENFREEASVVILTVLKTAQAEIKVAIEKRDADYAERDIEKRDRAQKIAETQCQEIFDAIPSNLRRELLNKATSKDLVSAVSEDFAEAFINNGDTVFAAMAQSFKTAAQNISLEVDRKIAIDRGISESDKIKVRQDVFINVDPVLVLTESKVLFQQLLETQTDALINSLAENSGNLEKRSELLDAFETSLFEELYNTAESHKIIPSSLRNHPDFTYS